MYDNRVFDSTAGEDEAAGAPEANIVHIDPLRYEVREEVARGGFGRVYSARDRHLDRPIAIKQLRFRGPSIDPRFWREVKIAARLQHPSIVPIYEAGAWPTGELFYTMKLITGRSFKDVIAGTSSLDERLALLPHVLAAAEAMAYAHSRRIIHRDLKPGNIMVGPFGETLVIDWGLAKSLDEGQEEPGASGGHAEGPELTQSGAVMGTPAYMSPEQAAGRSADERSDVYALGAVLYHLLCGDAPYEGADPGEAVAAVRRGPPPPIDVREPGAPAELVTIVGKAMARDPAARYPNAGEMAEDLRRFLAGQLVGAHRYSSAVLLHRWFRRNRVPIAVGAVALLVVLVISALSVQRIVRERDLARTAQATAETRRNQLLLAQARLLVEKKPTEALAYLKSYAASGHADWPATWAVAADARSRIVARHVFRGLRMTRVSPDGQLLAGLEADGDRLLVVDLRQGRSMVVRQGGPAVTHLALSTTALFARTEDHRLWRWDLPAGPPRQLRSVDEEASYLFTSKDGRYAAVLGKSGAIYLFDGVAGPVVLRGHTATAYGVFFSPDGRVLASTSHDLTTRLWSLPGGAPLRNVDVHGLGAEFSPDSRTLAVAGIDGNAYLIDVASGGKRTLSGHTDRLSRVVFTPDGRSLCTSSNDFTVRVWDLGSGTSRVLRGYQGIVETLAVSPDGRFLASGSGDQTIRVWDLALDESLVLLGHEDHVFALPFTPDSHGLVSVDLGGQVRVWDLPLPPALPPTGKVQQMITSRDGTVWTVGPGRLRGLASDGTERYRFDRADVRQPLAAATDGGHVATGGADGAVLLFSRGRRDPLALRGHTADVNALAISADGGTLASAGDDRVVRLWHTADGTPGPVLRGHLRALWALEFSSDGTRLFSAGDEHSARLWDLRAGTSRELPAADIVFTSSFSPDNRWLAWTAGDATVYLLSLADGALRRLGGHGAVVRNVAFSPDGRYLATGSDDRTIRLCRLKDDGCTVLGDDGAVRSVAFSTDGRLLLTESEPHTLRVWDVATLAELLVARGEPNIEALTLSPDGKHVFAAMGDEPFVRVWPLGGARPAASAGWLDRLSSVVLSQSGEIVSALPGPVPGPAGSSR